MRGQTRWAVPNIVDNADAVVGLLVRIPVVLAGLQRQKLDKKLFRLLFELK